MIAKCVAILAVVAQINAYVCNTNCGAPVVGSRIVGAGVSCGNTAATTRNFVAKGKYPVALSNTGPVPDCRVPITASRVTTPVQEKPLVRLPATIPAPKTVAHSCTCYKQILRPRVHDQYITVPSIQRYIETSHTPVIENIHYEAVPVNAPEAAGLSCINTGLVSGLATGLNAGYGAGVVPVAATAGLPVGVGAFPVSGVCATTCC